MKLRPAHRRGSAQPGAATCPPPLRPHVTGLPAVTGLGVADDLESLMVYTSKQKLVPEPLVFIAKLPLC